MPGNKPLVLSNGQLEQLQAPNDLDIPLEERFQVLEKRYNSLVLFMLSEGFDLPARAIEPLEIYV